MALLEQRRSRHIILGGCNIWMRDLAAYKATILKDYVSSSELAEYISSPADNDSLDYIIVPASKYKLNGVRCPEAFVSDHKALVACVEPQQSGAVQ